jgi:hypothetical protein
VDTRESLIAPMSRDDSQRLRMSVTSPNSHLLVDHGPIERVAPTQHGEGAFMTRIPNTTPPVGTR